MTKNTNLSAILSGTASLAIAMAFVNAEQAHAQAAPQPVAQTEPSAGASDIVVTARRRSEKSIDVPVSISALSQKQLDQKGLTNLGEIAQEVPGLKIDAGVLAFGGQIAMRGVSSPTSTASVEQAVTVNVDGIPVSYAGIVNLGQFDLGQVEVLRGPQALFFGKNATGGIISLNTAEPTNKLDVMVRAGYETEAKEFFTEGHISGPLSDTVKARLAVRYSGMQGYYNNYIPAGLSSIAFPPLGGFPIFTQAADPKGPGTKELDIKGTVIYEPISALTVKLHGAYSTIKTQDFSNSQRFYCPVGGVPQGPSAYPGETDCAVNNQTASGGLYTVPVPTDGTFTTFKTLNQLDSRFPADGVPYAKFNQALFSADVSYKLGNDLTLTSLTGYYHLALDGADQFSVGPFPFGSDAGTTRKDSFSEELRLASSFAGPFNFLGGAFYQHDRFQDQHTIYLLNPPTYVGLIPVVGAAVIKGETISPFVQASYKIVDQVSLSGGVRYTHETKSETIGQYAAFIPGQQSYDNFSPEAVLSWKPSKDVNTYVTYKQAYKSGGFQTEWIVIPQELVTYKALGAPLTIGNTFQPEKTYGFEAGIKANLFDHTMRVNLAAYDFTYSNLQVGEFNPVTVATIIQNAASATSKGLEGDFTYKPVHALTLTGSFAYNRSRYKSFIEDCYEGQTFAQGCTMQVAAPTTASFNPATSQQNLAGQSLPSAPQWVENIGFEYVGDLSSKLNFRINGSASFSSSYETLTENIPGAIQPAYSLFDAGLAIGSKDGRWEIAIIGKNLSNTYYATAGAQVPGVGSETYSNKAGVPADVFTTAGNRGRQFIFRLTLHPFG